MAHGLQPREGARHARTLGSASAQRDLARGSRAVADGRGGQRAEHGRARCAAGAEIAGCCWHHSAFGAWRGQRGAACEHHHVVGAAGRKQGSAGSAVATLAAFGRHNGIGVFAGSPCTTGHHNGIGFFAGSACAAGGRNGICFRASSPCAACGHRGVVGRGARGANRSELAEQASGWQRGAARAQQRGGGAGARAVLARAARCASRTEHDQRGARAWCCTRCRGAVGRCGAGWRRGSC